MKKIPYTRLTKIGIYLNNFLFAIEFPRHYSVKVKFFYLRVWEHEIQHKAHNFMIRGNESVQDPDNSAKCVTLFPCSIHSHHMPGGIQ